MSRFMRAPRAAVLAVVSLVLLAGAPTPKAETRGAPTGEMREVAVAPIFDTAEGEYYPTVHLVNVSGRSVHAEVEFRTNVSNTVAVELEAGESRTINGVDVLPADPPYEGRSGSAWLRHDGAAPDDVRAVVLVEGQDGDGNCYSVPFESARESGGDAPRTLVADLIGLGRYGYSEIGYANLGDEPATVDVTLRGVLPDGTMTADSSVSSLVVQPHESFLSIPGMVWTGSPDVAFGSIVASTTSPNVVARVVNHRSDEEGRLLPRIDDQEALDPSLARSTSKVLSPVVFDPSVGSTVYVSVHNMTANARRVARVTIPFGSFDVSRDVPLDPGEVRVVSFRSRDGAPSRDRTVSHVEVEHDGAPSDVVVAALTTDEDDERSIPARLVSAPEADAPRLVSPYLRVEAVFDAELVVTNFGDEDATFGARMLVSRDEGEFGIKAGVPKSLVRPVTSLPVTVPARTTIMLDIGDYLNDLSFKLHLLGAVELLKIRGGSRLGAVILTRDDLLAASNGAEATKKTRIAERFAPSNFTQVVRFAPAQNVEARPTTIAYRNHVYANPDGSYDLTFVTNDGAPKLSVGRGLGTVTTPVLGDDGAYHAVYQAPHDIPSHRFFIRARSAETGKELDDATIVVYLYLV